MQRIKFWKQVLPTLFLAMLLTMPGWAQTLTIPNGGMGSQFGIGDIISIAGSRNGTARSRNSSGRDKLQTAINIAGLIYSISRQRSESGIPNYPERGPRYPEQTPSYPDRVPNYPERAPRVPSRSPSPTTPGGLIQPQGYEPIVFSGRPIRLDPTILPLTINPGDSRLSGVVDRSVRTWNEAGLGQLFEITSGQADLTVDWSGSKVSPGARAETRMSRSSTRVVPTDLSIRTAGRNSDQLARVLTHELGHVLGLDHSQDRSDVMYYSEQNRSPELTGRDRQMLHWLYSQNDYFPVIGRTDLGNGPAVAGSFLNRADFTAPVSSDDTRVSVCKHR